MLSKYKIHLLVVEPRGSGGMIHYAYQMCNAMAEYASEVTLVTSLNYELENYPHLFKVVRLLDLWTQNSPLSKDSRLGLLKPLQKIFRGFRRIFRGMRYFLAWIKLTRYLLKVHPDILQFGAIEFAFEAIFLSYLKSRGLILSQVCHEFEPREENGSFLTWLNNRLLNNVFNQFSIFFFHGEINRERFKQLYPTVDIRNSHIIYHGNSQIFPLSNNYSVISASLKKRYCVNGTESIVLFFGNITPSKGVPDLLRAFAKVHAEKKEAKLIIAGKPLKYIDADELRRLANELGLASVTIFDLRYLPLDEVRPLIELSNVVVYPYLTSTQSGSIQVAYAFGKPVVATSVGGLPDEVEEGKSGLLVSPNAPDQLAEAILKLMNDPDCALQMGMYGKFLSETRFSWAPIAKDVIHSYKIFLGNVENGN